MIEVVNVCLELIELYLFAFLSRDFRRERFLIRYAQNLFVRMLGEISWSVARHNILFIFQMQLRVFPGF